MLTGVIHSLLSASDLVGALAAAPAAGIQLWLFSRCKPEMKLREHLRDLALQIRFAALLGLSLAVLTGIEQQSIGAAIKLTFGYAYGWILTILALYERIREPDCSRC